MTNIPTRFPELISLLDKFSLEIDMTATPKEARIENLDIKWGALKVTKPLKLVPFVEAPAIWIVGQGLKTSYSGGKQYDYVPGNAMVVFHPMAVKTEIIEASKEKPLLVVGAFIKLQRMIEVLQRIERIEGPSQKTEGLSPSGIIEMDLTDKLLDPFIRLFHSLENPTDAEFLTDSILDEIYYRLLSGEHGEEMRYLLRQRGEIIRISKAVDYIHQNLDEQISVEKLADMVHMAQPTFYENFRSVMHTSPLKYAKSIKLNHAQQLIKQGKKANEAGYMVGYNSPAQFSREYKRHFGFAPSETQKEIVIT